MDPRPAFQPNVPPPVQNPEHRTEYEQLTRWTMELASNDNASGVEFQNSVSQAGATQHDDMNPVPDHVDGSPEAAADSAYQLARELADIAIDEADFETPAFLRRKEDAPKNA